MFTGLLFSQLSPEKPGLQSHRYLLTSSRQVPPFVHGFETHSSTLVDVVARVKEYTVQMEDQSSIT